MKKQGNFRRMLTLSKKGRVPLVIAVFLAALNGVLSVLPYYISYLVASILLHSPVSSLSVQQLLAALLVVLVLKALTGTVSGLFSHYTAYNMLYDIRVGVVEKMAKLPLGYFTQHSAGEIRKTLVEDIEKLEKFFAHHIGDFVKITVMPITAFLLLFGVHPGIALISLIPIVIALAFQVLVFRSYGTMMDEYYAHSQKISTTVVEYIRGMPVVKAFGKTIQTFLRFNQVLEDYQTFWMKFVKKTGLPFVAFSVCSDAGFLFALPIGIVLTAAGTISLPQLFLLLSVGASYTLFLPMLGQVASTLSVNLKNLDGVFEILDTPALAETAGNQIILPSHDIEIRNLTFGYTPVNPVIHNISLSIRQGQTIALVGPSGAGKSTLANLIARFYDPQQGDILLGGVDIKQIPYTTLMEQVAYVFQENFTFGDTVFENIRMYRTDISRDRVIQAAKLAQAHDFIMDLPQGYDTILGARGTYLSGGQLQRLNIARALIKDAPIVILDEATAFADPENESLILRALNALLKDKTVIVIAHRLRTIRGADQIVVLENGGIVQKGTFDQLANKKGLFQDMWQAGETSAQWKFNVGRQELCKE